MWLIPLLFLAFAVAPAYAEPICTDASYSAISGRTLQDEWKDVVASEERVCIIARLEWAHRDNRKKLDIATLQPPAPSDYILLGSVDLSKLERNRRREIMDKCGSPTTGQECVVAMYGRLEQEARLRWIVRADRVEW